MSAVEDFIRRLPIALGNPIRSRWLEPDTDHAGDLWQTGFIEPPDDFQPEERLDKDSTAFLYRADKERYETGYHISVSYLWNEEEPNCFENKILEKGVQIDLPTFRDKIFDKVKEFLQAPVTLARIKTVNGSLEISQLDRIPESSAYPPIPDSLALVPRVPISGLQKCPVNTAHQEIDVVTRVADPGPCKQWYTFKRYAIPIEHKGHTPMEDLLSDVEYLSRVDSPYVIKPAFLVTDGSKSLFRGFLTPFYPAGTLEDVFAEMFFEASIYRQPMFLHPRHLELFVLHICAEDEGSDDDELEQEEMEVLRDLEPCKPPGHQLPWRTKHKWAIEATSGLVDLHDLSIYSGDVKLSNILLDRDGHLQFIDVAPQGGFTGSYVAPEIDLSDDTAPFPLSEARDIFAFGIVLWQIAEEEWRVDRDDPTQPPNLTWESAGYEATPLWYRDLVVRCVDIDPAKRPSAKYILDMLKSNK